MAKRTFSRQTTPASERLLRVFGLYIMPAAVCLGLILAVSWLSSFNPLARDLQARALKFMEPVIALTHGPVTAIQEKYNAIWTVTTQADALEQLRRENAELKHWIQVAQMMKAENKALKGLMNVETKEALSFTTAQIVVDNSSSYAHTALVELPEGHKVQKGQAALVDKGLIGRVVETGAEYARIMLLRDINARIPVVVEETGDKAILTGANKDEPVLEHLSPYHTVKSGQKVITSGHGGAFPYGIEVGETVRAQDGTLKVRLYADSRNASFVKIVDYGLKPLMTGGSYAASAFSNIH